MKRPFSFKTVITLCLISISLQAKKCYFYFDDASTLYNLKDLRRLRDKTIDTVYDVSETESYQGSLLVGLCQDVDIPPECASLPPSFFYFTYKEPSLGNTVCIDLLAIKGKEKELKLNEDVVSGFSMKSDRKGHKFVLNVSCDPNNAYPQLYTFSRPDKVTQLNISSKFSCGEVNQISDVLDSEKYILCVFLMIFGLFLLMYGGISFEKYMLIIILIIVTILSFFTLMTLFDFKFNSGITAIFWAICLGIGVAVRIAAKTIKYLAHGVFAFFGGTVGLKFAQTLFPDAYIYQQAFFAFVLVLLIKILLILLAIYFRDFICLVLSAFIGSCLFVYNLGYITHALPNLFKMLDEIDYKDDYVMVS